MIRQLWNSLFTAPAKTDPHSNGMIFTDEICIVTEPFTIFLVSKHYSFEEKKGIWSYSKESCDKKYFAEIRKYMSGLLHQQHGKLYHIKPEYQYVRLTNDLVVWPFNEKSMKRWKAGTYADDDAFIVMRWSKETGIVSDACLEDCWPITNDIEGRRAKYQSRTTTLQTIQTSLPMKTFDDKDREDSAPNNSNKNNKDSTPSMIGHDHVAPSSSSVQTLTDTPSQMHRLRIDPSRQQRDYYKMAKELDIIEVSPVKQKRSRAKIHSKNIIKSTMHSDSGERRSGRLAKKKIRRE